mgnify:CR=1 FL=1
MSGKTISVVKGKGSIQHNNRQFLTENIDRQRVKENIIYVQQDIREAYQQVFGKAVADYNAKQKQKCRRIDDYYEKVRQSKNGEQLFHEIVVQVGDMTDSGYGTDDFNKCRQVLDDYMSDFTERNPHIHVFNAVMHLDECTPHLHIDFIPIGEGYKKGMSVRNSLNKSMEVYGVGDKVGILGWYEQEREVLTECANRHGVQITQKNEHRKDLSLVEYKRTMRELEKLTELKNELKKDIKGLEDLKTEDKTQKQEISELEPKKILGRVSSEDYEKLRQVSENYRSRLTVIEVENKELKQELEVAKADKKEVLKEVSRLKIELFDSKQEVKTLRKGREDFENQIKKDVEQKWSKWKERCIKLENALEKVKHEFDYFREQFSLGKSWRKEFLEQHGLWDKYSAFISDKREEHHLLGKWRKELEAQYASRDFVKEKLEQRLKVFRDMREDNRRLEKLKVDDPQVYQQEMFKRAEVERVNAMRFNQEKSRGQSLGR